jgi:SAM-dependent methyltransferase
MRDITYISAPTEVSMADRWFEIATIDHFWINRRFQVLRRLTGDMIASADEIAEVGCGHGLLQKQIEETYERRVTGFDLNEFALKRNVSDLSAICCYNIFQKEPRFQQRFDLIFLFDVLEHIQDEFGFIQAILFHLRPGGRLVVNVPAGSWAYSTYDQAAGHLRRYSIESLRAVTSVHNLGVTSWTYWGLPLIPTLAVRKLWLMGRRNKSEIISVGFDSRNRLLDRILALISRCEATPQKLLGTSLMAVLRDRQELDTLARKT